MPREHAPNAAGPTAPRRTPVPPALTLLRDRTSSAHTTLDAGLAGHDRRILDEPDYARLISVLAELHAAVEDSLQAWVEATPWVRDALGDAVLPSRAGLYADDLAGLGATRPAPHPVEAYDDAQGLATLYLLSGSAKGARVLLKGLPEGLADASRTGLQDAASRDSARLWGAVVALLGEPLEQAHPTGHRALASAAADHAVDVFARLHGLAAQRAEPRGAMAG